MCLGQNVVCCGGSDVMTLKGKTVFITGGSRGIGRAIALRAARDGANVVIAAKTATPHHKLSGTIYTVADEVRKAGGQALACIVDIRFEDQIQEAVQKAVDTFGGIDILVNNASAISLTGTLDTTMKKYDLMSSINARGTFLCSKVCLPHLMKSDNPHILNISPPLNLRPMFFQSHCAYTIAKYGMSLCVLGMAAEFEDEGVAVNALWPRTAIWTAATKENGLTAANCRTDDIMSDAAYIIVTRPSRKFTGNFCVDDAVLYSEGVTNFDKYRLSQGGTLFMDLYVDESLDEFTERIEREQSVPKSKL
ncbi:short chain dehydrogenase [Elysia marginata]|uniref:Hydroxysteroid dehydrogenase-like protein 2 n=1 Tax=Elysia marginata TaxID=1093978 RepID=A0AAV4ISP9_9GAST|nr:short chain dehydrogenase [Elysia marginata]